jgi:hypothetical protein
MRHHIRAMFNSIMVEHVVYSCLDVDDELLESMRAGEGVEFVDWNFSPCIMLE